MSCKGRATRAIRVHESVIKWKAIVEGRKMMERRRRQVRGCTIRGPNEAWTKSGFTIDWINDCVVIEDVGEEILNSDVNGVNNEVT